MTRTLTILVTVAAVLLVGVAASAQEPAPRPVTHVSTPGEDDYVIGPEDVLEIIVYKNADLSRVVQVRPDGKISLPLINDVQAADLSPMELRAAVTKAYSQYLTEPEVSVLVKEVHSIKVSVLGQVRTSGRFELHSQATVMDALAMAGGFTDYAKRDRIVVHRRNGSIVPFNYIDVLNTVVAGAVTKQNITLEPGDIILVP
jgi:polysaccharide export outer membrane protein